MKNKAKVALFFIYFYLFFLLKIIFLGGVAAAVLLWGGGVKFHQYGVFANFADLREWNKNILPTFKNIPKPLVAWQNESTNLTAVDIKNNVNNIHHFFSCRRFITAFRTASTFPGTTLSSSIPHCRKDSVNEVSAASSPQIPTGIPALCAL